MREMTYEPVRQCWCDRYMRVCTYVRDDACTVVITHARVYVLFVFYLFVRVCVCMRGGTLHLKHRSNVALMSVCTCRFTC